MKVFKLNSSHYPDTTVKNFDSLVWTERYQTAGDFQLVVENEINIIDSLPLGTLISHTDTKSVMIVENHEIERDSNRRLLITISGRTFETFAENRAVQGSDLPLYDPITDLPNSDISYSTSAEIVARSLLRHGLQPGSASADDEVTNLLVDTDVMALDPSQDHDIKRGDLYSRVIELLNLADAGIKIVRPYGIQTTLNMIIHDGHDLTGSIIFYAQYEDLEDAKYFWSIKDYKNYAQIATHSSARLHEHRDLLSPLTGLERRTMYVEANDIEGIFGSPTSTDAVGTRAQINLDGHKKTQLLQAKISKTAKPKFKLNYDVGDLVTVFGEFAVAQTMRVTEHILTVDKDGMRGFPSLSAV